jgi:hypothetical protein
MEINVINNKEVLSKKTLIENCNNCQFSNDSELFLKIFSSENLEIKNEDIGKNGDVIFSLSQKSIGLTDENMKKYPILRSKYFANFIGEFLVRKNINKFLKMLLGIDADEYGKVVCGYNHKDFGMDFCPKSKTFKFQFHISLIQNILTEDLNNIISIKK